MDKALGDARLRVHGLLMELEFSIPLYSMMEYITKYVKQSSPVDGGVENALLLPELDFVRDKLTVLLNKMR